MLGATKAEVAEWIASMLRDECNCLNGRLEHGTWDDPGTCLGIINPEITGEELLKLLGEKE